MKHQVNHLSLITAHRPRSRPLSGLLNISFLRFTATLLLAMALGLVPRLSAAPGAAPAAQERRVLSGVHTDAVSVSAVANSLSLGTRADVDGESGVALDPALTLFNVEESTRTTLQANPAYDFLGSAGSDVWIAPQSNPGSSALWPGISTKGIPDGFLDSNEVTFRLDDVSGPGTLHIYQTNAFGSAIRLLSGSGSDYRTWTTGRGQHAHANWAFSAAGTYTVTFVASAMKNGVPISDTQAYTFIVGDVPAPVAAATTLTTSTSNLVQGASVSLRATVSSPNAVGWVEFLDGATILGHKAVADGSATLDTTDLPLGTRSVTARFVPEWLNDFSPSISAPVAITVTEPGGVPFGVIGVAAVYQPGDTLAAQVVGHTLQEGQQYRWLWRPVGSTATGLNAQTSVSPAYSRTLSASEDGYEISVTVRQCTNATCSSGTVIAQTAWVQITLAHDGPRPVLTRTIGSEQVYPWDTVRLEASELNLADGETAQFVYATTTGNWTTNVSLFFTVFTYPEPDVIQVDRSSSLNPVRYRLAVRVLRDGIAVRQSEPVLFINTNFELLIEGLQQLYMEGAAASLSGTLYPHRETDAFVYQWQFSKLSNFDASDPSTTVWSEDTVVPAGVTQVLNVADHDNGYLRLRVLKPGWIDSVYVDSVVHETAAVRLYVTDDPNAQLFFFGNLSVHYHQGANINLNLTVFPELLPGDQILWEWKWPGADWTAFPGASGKQNPVTAEQALHGVQVRATLDFAAESREPVLAGPVTILIDDHGAAARQQPAVAGVTAYTEGDQVTLTRQLPANGPTILTTHLWERKVSGASEFSPIAGATTAALSFHATLVDDGSEYRVSILKPDGSVAYGPSAALSIAVEPRVITDPKLALTVQGGTLGVAVAIPLGDTYELQFSETLEEDSWSRVGEPITGSGEPFTLFPPSSGGKGFYRLRQLMNP